MEIPFFHCSFCGKRKGEVKSLVAGPNAFICDECVALCRDIINKDAKAPQSPPPPPLGPSLGQEDVRCSFCGRNEDEVRKLIAGPVVYICDVCIARAEGVVADSR